MKSPVIRLDGLDLSVSRLMGTSAWNHPYRLLKPNRPATVELLLQDSQRGAGGDKAVSVSQRVWDVVSCGILCRSVCQKAAAYLWRPRSRWNLRSSDIRSFPGGKSYVCASEVTNCGFSFMSILKGHFKTRTGTISPAIRCSVYGSN